MRRGTTPTLLFTLPEAISMAGLYITFSQSGNPVLEKTLEDVTIDGATLTLPLSQEDTLKFKESAGMQIQLRILTLKGEALASEYIQCPVGGILKEGVI